MSVGPVNFLLVDDLEENLLALEGLLRREDLELHKARSAQQALEVLLVHDIALAIIDVQMPEMDGFQLAELMRGTERTRRVPIIFLTAGAIDHQRRFRGYDTGAVDFLFKPIEADVLRSKADVFFELCRQRQEVARQRDELQAASQALKIAKEQAEAANRAKDRFLAVLSHELRTPLTPVLMTVSLLESDPTLLAETRKTMSMLRRNVEIEARLIDDLLDVSRVLNGKLPLNTRQASLRTVVEHALETCGDEAHAKRIRLTTHFESSHDQVVGDPARLQQVFWNLLRNAIKFTPEGGSIEVSAKASGGQSIEVSVRDNGIDIAPELLERIFNPFDQGDADVGRRYGGLGLGLAICKGIVDLHHGKLSAHSEGPGTGACFSVRLPLSVGNRTEPPRSSFDAPEHADGAKALRILLAEDHEDTALVLSTTLRMDGHEVDVTGTVEGALRLAAAHPYDLLVSDLGLPDASGYELMRQIRDRHQMSGIAMSGYGMDEDLLRSREAGFIEHLVKPVDVLEIRDALRRICENRKASKGS